MSDGAGNDVDPTAGKGRLESFSDGVIAILITIMVLELRIPDALAHGLEPRALAEFGPKVGAYGLSFLVLAIMWLNHHDITRDLRRLTPGFAWLNMCLLFAMSLIPLVTAFYGAHPASSYAAASYGAVLAMSSWSYVGLRGWLERHESDAHRRGAHHAIQRKNLLGAGLYTLSVPLAFVSAWAPLVIFLLIPAMFFTPNLLLPKGLRSR